MAYKGAGRRKRAGRLLACLLAFALPLQASALSSTEITALRVGKADAILLSTAESVILLDAGEDEDASEILAYLEKKRVQRLDAMIITHYDKDHVGGADGVLKGIAVDAVYDAAYEGSGKQYEQYLDALEASGVARTRVTEEMELTFPGITLTLMPTMLQMESDNDNSLVILARDAWRTFLFAGDAEEARLSELLAAGLPACALVKLPHHGRWKENLADFLDATSPEIVVITDSQQNPADEETLRLLEQRNIQTLRTIDGDIRVISGESGLTAMRQ